MNWDLVILIALKLLAVVALVLMNGFFVSTEFALVKVRATQLEAMASRNHKRAKMALTSESLISKPRCFKRAATAARPLCLVKGNSVLPQPTSSGSMIS